MIPPGQTPVKTKHWYFVTRDKNSHKIHSFYVKTVDKNGVHVGNEWTTDINKATKFTKEVVEKLSRSWSLGRGDYGTAYL